MNLINKESLSLTLDNVNQIFFEDKKLSSQERKEIAVWIAGRQGLEGSYAKMFAPAKKDYGSTTLFTGDKIPSKASTGHILGEESLRALYLLNVNDKKIESAIKNASTGIKSVVNRNWNSGYDAEGTFCCGKCTVAFWRNLSAEGVDKNEKSLNAGIKYLTKFRDGKGKWGRFPFFYTLLALNDINLHSAREEIKYASGICEKYVKQKDNGDIYRKRKKEIAKQSLKIVGLYSVV